MSFSHERSNSCCICSPSQMILLVLLWLWSNEDLLNLGFHEVLVVDLSIQPPLLEFESSISLCVIDTSRSISLPATHIILPMYWTCAPFDSSNFTCVDDRISLKRLRARPAVYGFIIRCMTWYPRHQRCLDFTNTDLCNYRITSTVFWSKLFISVRNLLTSRASSASF